MTLILDHINGINNDDRIENLRWVCGNCNMQLPTTNARNQVHKKYFCPDCGKQVSEKGRRCLQCANLKKQTEKPVSRDELKNLIKTTSFVEIGKMFGVSDNAIRKWCIFYNLPHKSSDIKKISDDDWKKI